jgi:hypothetical protein
MGAIGYRLYLLITGGTILAVCLTCSVTAFWLEPVSEDLARLGGYAENDYGWNGEQTRFIPPLAAVGKLGRAYDVVVVGDSFSISEEAAAEPQDDLKTHWTDFFVARTGLSVGSFHRNSVTLETYLASDGFLKAPPKLLVVEYAERTLQWAPSGKECVTLAPRHVGVLPINPSPTQPWSYGRNRSHSIDTHMIDSAIDFLKKNVPRWIAGLNVTTVSNYPLSRTNLFTSKNNGQLLVYEDDFAKAHMSDGFLRDVACYFTQVQSRVEANGATKFVVMIAPDRTTTYGDYLPDVRLPNLTAEIASTRGLNILRLDQTMKAAVASGTEDIYLPSDTHWASRGMAIAADTLIRFVGSSDGT